QRRGEIFGARTVTGDREGLVLGLVPPVLAAMSLPGLHVDRVVGEDRERRHAVLAEVLVLIVAPEQDEIGLEGVELGADLPEVMDQVIAVLLGVAGPLVGAPLLAHGRIPALRRSPALRQQWIGHQELDAARHVALVRKRGVVRDAESEYLPHGSSSVSPIV